jgi:hypothetical protein
MNEATVSGCIKHRKEGFSGNPEGDYTIRDKYGQGWAIPTRNITPNDLRAMADHLEKQLKEKAND